MTNSSARIAGMDVGDKHSQVCLVDPLSGEVLEETRLRTTAAAIERYFGKGESLRIALEVGPHSPWISRALEDCGHEVLVANARQVRLIYAGRRKNDRLDAEKLARLARYDEKLLSPITHRSEEGQADLANIRSRDALVKTRTGLVCHVRSTVKAFGSRIPKCSTKVFHKRAGEHLPELLRPALEPVIQLIARLNEVIKAFDDRIEQLAESKYPETTLLRQVRGVGPVTGLAYILTLEDPARFHKSREVGPYLGLTPGERQSGDNSPQQRITKQGDVHLRRLLVQCSQYILGPKGGACDLRRHGEKLEARGGAHAKQKALTAVARKLSVLLHHLWATGEIYDPNYNYKRNQPTQVAA